MKDFLSNFLRFCFFTVCTLFTDCLVSNDEPEKKIGDGKQQILLEQI